MRITGAKAEGREKAKQMIQGLTREPEVGEVFDGKVTRIMSIGAFVEYLPGKEGLVRISEISNDRVNRIEDVVKVGDKVQVKVAEVDRQGRVNLSMRAVNEDGNGFEERQRAERARFNDREGGDRGGFRPGGPGGGGGGFRRSGRLAGSRLLSLVLRPYNELALSRRASPHARNTSATVDGRGDHRGGRRFDRSHRRGVRRRDGRSSAVRSHLSLPPAAAPRKGLRGARAVCRANWRPDRLP